LDELVVEFAGPARSREISLAVVPSRTKVLSQPILLLGMLRNLVRNAIDYTPRGGRVLVSCRRDGPETRIEVCDSGAGIHPDVLPHIFSAFRRSDNTRVDGLGLGLFIVKKTADFLDHRIYVRSAVGRGSCFGVIAESDELSRRQAPQRADERLVASQA
jgi:signal transduction histidine kinase